jgi:ring-1,2-phenylacetyl-CoA epoxidase subunit PaaE
METTDFHQLRISALKRETDDAISIAFDVPDRLRESFAFCPGQYLTLRTYIDGSEVRRSYSICSAPDDGMLCVAIKRIENGAFSGWAHCSLQAGDMIDVMPPAGRFTVASRQGHARTYLGIAAGSGITPILSIMKAILAREPRSHFSLLYGNRTTASILFRSELEALKDRFIGRLSIVHILSKEQQDIPILNGRVDATAVKTLLPSLMPGTLPDIALLCGPGEMIDAATAVLAAAGMPQTAILSERFFAGTIPISRPRMERPLEARFATATIIADGVSTSIPVAEDETVLDAALRAGLDLPYSCHAGMCSTCRARVTDGTVVMTVNYGLEPWETKAGYVLTCQATPTTTRVTVDYDHV